MKEANLLSIVSSIFLMKGLKLGSVMFDGLGERISLGRSISVEVEQLRIENVLFSMDATVTSRGYNSVVRLGVFLDVDV